MLNELPGAQPPQRPRFPPLPLPGPIAGGDELHVDDILDFGPFRLIGAERLLLRDGRPVTLGGRAFDLLMVLTRQAGRVVSAQDLHRLVWRDVTVEEANLRVCVAALRRALGQRQDGSRYIVTIVGRGYMFVAPVRRTLPDTDGGATRGPSCQTSPGQAGEHDARPAPPRTEVISAANRGAGGPPWSVVLPGLAICLTLVSYGLIGGNRNRAATGRVGMPPIPPHAGDMGMPPR